jgi:RNA-directed DNA polymerase
MYNRIWSKVYNQIWSKINREKSGIRRPLNFNILGYGFVPTYHKGDKGKYQLVVQEKRWESLKAKMKEITRKTTPMSFDERHRLGRPKDTKIKRGSPGLAQQLPIGKHA